MAKARRKAATVALVLALSGSHAAAQPMPVEPWEPYDVVAPESDAPTASPMTGDVLRDALIAGIDAYRQHAGPASVRRCPFVVSCSAYAEGLIGRYGVAGLLAFADRFFYREHVLVFAFYSLSVTDDGTLRLDDGAR